MPNLKSAKKALRQSIKRAEKNLKNKVEAKGLIKQVRKAVEAGDNKAGEILKQTGKKLDKIAKTGYFKKNKVSRLKSRLAKKVNKMKK
ncbi:MAG: 30S ribosomal protein S20 [Parcubacteria group bacterium CG10_big_fil_rev_8_21_14_0_10_36_14]|nr:MAG: 30S ribosomal protein S20 [Parcubacteria group bacterium CG10_big_fil_rev_8_21_14_0_10_36_14]